MAERYGRGPHDIHLTLSRDVAPTPSFARGRLRRWSADYEVHAPLDLVFGTYVSTHPAVGWPGRWVRFWAACSGDGGRVLASDPWPGMSVGMKLCCGLRLLTPTDAFNVWTGVQVTEIEPRRRLRYEYLEGSTTAGVNQVTFQASGARTRVSHRSEYCGATRLEHALLPWLEARYHAGFVDGMHSYLGQLCEQISTRDGAL